MPLRYTLRSLRRTPAFTLTAVLTLVIGIGATLAIFAILSGVLLRPLPYGNPDRLVGAWHDLPGVSLTHAQQMSATYFTYKRLAHTIEAIGVYQTGAGNLALPGGSAAPRRVGASWVTASVIPLLQVPPLKGRSFTEAEDLPNGPYVAVISEGLWRGAFGADPAIVGKSLDLNGRTRQIIGVMPKRFRFPSAATDVWLPLGLDPHPTLPGGFNYDGIARLKPGVTITDAQRDLAAVLPRIVDFAAEIVPGLSMQMVLDQAKPVPLLVPLQADLVGDFSRTLWTVGAAALLVLLVACFNVANLILVRADGRQRELAVREALGAGRSRVLGQFLAESSALALLDGAGGLVLAWVALRVLVASRLGGNNQLAIPRLEELGIDLPTGLFAVGLCALVALVCGLVPALRIRPRSLETALREGGRTGTSRAHHRVRGALVAGQIALALVVLAGSGLLLRSYLRLNAVRLGFEPDHVATFWLLAPAGRYPTTADAQRFYAALSERVAALPGVQSVGLTSRLPLASGGMNVDPYYVEGDASTAGKIPPLQIFTTVDDNYFKTMGIPLLAGRGFDPLTRQRWDEAIISRRTAQQFYGDSTGRAAIGKRFRELPQAPWVTVVGVVGDVRDTSLTAATAQVVYWPAVVSPDSLYDKTYRTQALVVRTKGDPAAITGSVQRVVRELDPTLPTFDVRPMTEVVRAKVARLSLTIMLLGAAAVVTLLLGAVGLYGVMAYLVTLRTRELGVRLALGAAPGQVVAMFTRQGLGLTAAGVVGGLAVFLLVSRFLRGMLFGVAPSDPLTLIAASALLVAIAALASWIPARRAARVDPVRTLRSE